MSLDADVLPLHALWCAIADDRGEIGTRARLSRVSSETVPEDAPPPDRACAERIRQGDRTAFDAMVQEHATHLVQLAALMLRDRDTAEDVVQDVFVAIWRGRAEWALRGTLRGYLTRAVANRVRGVQRRSANRHRLETIEHDTIAPTAAAAPVTPEDGDVDDALWTAVHTLAPRWREAIVLRYVQRLSFADVGGVMGISEDAAKKLVRRAIAALRETLLPTIRARDTA